MLVLDNAYKDPEEKLLVFVVQHFLTVFKFMQFFFFSLEFLYVLHRSPQNGAFVLFMVTKS